MKTKYRNGPGVGLLAGDVAGIHRKRTPDYETMWGCFHCGDGISSGVLCFACVVEARDTLTALESIDTSQGIVFEVKTPS